MKVNYQKLWADFYSITPVYKKYTLNTKIIEEFKSYFLNKSPNLKSFKEDIKKNYKLQFFKIRDSIKESKELLESYPGFFIFDIDSQDLFSLEQKKIIYFFIANEYGNLVSQNIDGDTVVEVYDKGKSISTGARYHESNAFGHLHTDSPQYVNVPPILSFFCISDAKEGGETLLVNAYALYKRIQDENINILKCLFSPYHFDKRGHNKQNENTTTFKNIMSFKNNNLYFRYLRSYIDSGHKKRNIELKKSQILALNYLDKLLDEDSMQFKIKINKGECIFINNNFIAHGRGAFVDHKELSKKRLYLRLWIA